MKKDGVQTRKRKPKNVPINGTAAKCPVRGKNGCGFCPSVVTVNLMSNLFRRESVALDDPSARP